MESDKSKNVFVYLDIQIGDINAGRVVIELFRDVVPKSVDNFRSLCKGDKGVGTKGKKLHYKGTTFHRVVPQFLIQGGDICADGSCGDSIYGGQFEDENFTLLHHTEGTVGMANNGPNTNISQFYITLVPCPHLDGTNVVIGYVRKGMSVMMELSEVQKFEEKPIIDCLIADCGEFPPGCSDYGLQELDGTPDIFPPWPEDYDFTAPLNNEGIIALIKVAADQLYDKDSFSLSERKYKKVLRYIDWIIKNKLRHGCNHMKSMEMQTLLDLASVKIRQGRYKNAVEFCTQVISYDSSNSKAMYRRGKARLKLKDYEKAIADMQATAELQPGNTKVHDLLMVAKQSKQRYLEKERALYGKMFK